MELSRRDFLAQALGAPFVASSIASCGDAEVAREVEGEFTGPRMELGHALRDGHIRLGDFEGARRRRVGVAILGGGPAGLSAAYRLARRGHDDFVVIDMEPAIGGTSRSGETRVSAHPWGAHYVPLPMAQQRDLTVLLEEMGAVVGHDEHGNPVGAEHVLVREPDERLFESGFWHRGLFPSSGATASDGEQLTRWLALVDRYASMRDGRGRRAFGIPVDLASDDAELRHLDEMTAAELLDRSAISSPRVRWWIEYGCRDDYGLTLETASAWAALFYTAARKRTGGEETQPLLTWPEGNGAIVAHLAAAAGDARIRAGRMVVDVEPRADGATIRTLSGEGEGLEIIDADWVICAMPRYISRRILRPLREQPENADPFTHGPWLVANLHLDGRPFGLGFEPCWDNVLYDSPSLGYVAATHQRGRDFGPTVWTYYLPFTDADADAGRRRLLEPSWADVKELVVRDLSRAHPDLSQHLRRIDVCRWGHAMVQPRPGTIFGAGRRDARTPIGRIHFAHSELSGVALFEEAFHHGLRAADEIISASAPAPATVIDTPTAEEPG